MDICTRDENGNPWDFTKSEMRSKAARRALNDEPLVVIGSPPCTDWSTVMNLNHDKMGLEETERRRKVAREHLEFCVELYRIQIKGGRYFIHEHPQSAASWHEDVMLELSKEAGVMVTAADQCAYGLKTKGPYGDAPAQKPTRFMTNAPCIASEFSRGCPNRMSRGRTKHQHIPLMNGRAKAAQEHPNRLCEAICRGIVKQIDADRQGRFLLATLQDSTTQGDIERICMQINDQLETVIEEDHP